MKSRKRISEYFVTHTRAKIHQYNTELRNTKKGSRTIAEYLLRIKALVDALIVIGGEVSEQEHVNIILEGLPNNYDAFLTALCTRKETYLVSEIESLLLAQEIRIDRDTSKSVVANYLSANPENVNTKDKNNKTEKLPSNVYNSQMYSQNSRSNFQT